MKIVKEKTPPPKYEWLGIWECLRCHSEVLWEERDATGHTHPSLRGGYSDPRESYAGTWKMNCPVCQSEQPCSKKNYSRDSTVSDMEANNPGMRGMRESTTGQGWFEYESER